MANKELITGNVTRICALRDCDEVARIAAEMVMYGVVINIPICDIHKSIFENPLINFVSL